MQTVLITGCASGFGAALADRWLTLGHRVVATDPNLSALTPLADRGALTLALDVRDTDAIATAIQAANAWSPVDVLVNNGGYALFGTQEETDISLVQDMFDVNVFGPARMTQALLPTLRERGGTVVQISSVAGRTVFPESGWYAATKHALEAMTEALIQECASFGMRFRLVEPGSFATRFLDTATAMSPPREARSPYASAHDRWDRRKQGVLEPPQDPELVVDAILDSLASDVYFERVVVGEDAARILALRESIGADAFSMLQARRNGAPLDWAPQGHVLTPTQIAAAFEAGTPQLEPLEATLIALHEGHLEHWAESEAGQTALRLLDALFRAE